MPETPAVQTNGIMPGQSRNNPEIIARHQPAACQYCETCGVYKTCLRRIGAPRNY